MGCVITNIECYRVDSPLVVTGGGRLDNPIEVSQCIRIDTPIEVTCSTICDVGIGEFVRFALSSLSWVGDDNNEGVTKYNTLISSGAWSLEEVEIEELL